MMRQDNKAPAMSGDKARMCPDNELKKPQKTFENTFSAETVLLEAFFPAK